MYTCFPITLFNSWVLPCKLMNIIHAQPPGARLIFSKETKLPPSITQPPPSSISSGLSLRVGGERTIFNYKV